MKKLPLILVLVLSLAFTALAENPEKPNAIQKDGFKVKPKLFWATITPFIIRSDNLIGLNVLSLDASLLKYKDFHFLAVGGGLQTYYKQTVGWHTYDDYWTGYPRTYYGMGYKFLFEFYLKFVPVKWRWNWASKVLKIDAYLEVGITHKGDPIIGLTFGGSPFKKKKKK